MFGFWLSPQENNPLFKVVRFAIIFVYSSLKIYQLTKIVILSDIKGLSSQTLIKNNEMY